MPLGSELFKKKALDSRGDEDMNQPARNIVDSLMSACLDAFPGFFASLGLPSSMEAIDRITPYELAVVVFRKWDHAEELTNQTTSVSPKWKRDLLQFCVQAMLYRFNIIITPKYKPLFQQAKSEASP